MLLMATNIRNDLPPVQSSLRPANQETAKTSGNDRRNNAANAVNSSNSVDAVSSQQKMQSLYSSAQSGTILEQEMDKLIKQIMPDLGISFRVHESGNIITTVTNNTTQEVVREFPAEKILDIVHSMVQRLGIVTNKKV
jgi:uncharacterized FlaG/YvyC family protein